jgi:hypothetical protein
MRTLPEPERRTYGRWLTRERVVFYSCILLSIDFVPLFIRLYERYVLGNTHLLIPGWDFAVFWSASYLTIHYGALSAFDWARIEQLALPLQGLTSTNMLTPWVYPPTFLLGVWPFALVPFPFSCLAFVLGGLLFAAFAVTRLIGSRLPAAFWFATAAFPPVWIAAMTGQNSFVTAGLIGLGLAWMDRRPRLAGVCFGLLAIKPQLGVLVPVALALGGRWRTFTMAAFTACFLCLLAGAALGFDTYMKFYETAAAFGNYVIEKAPYWPSGMPTVFGAANRAGLTVGAAYAIHGGVATIAVAAMTRLWIRHARATLRAAGLLIATLLCQPYLMSYDLVWMGLALLLLWQDTVSFAWRRGELIVMVVAWFSPVVFLAPLPWPVGNAMPIVLLALLAVIVLRSRAENVIDSVVLMEVQRKDPA